MTLEEMLENKYTTKLEWMEPWPATRSDGMDVEAHVILRATVQCCINLQRSAAKAAIGRLDATDEQLLMEFTSVRWATVVG